MVSVVRVFNGTQCQLEQFSYLHKLIRQSFRIGLYLRVCLWKWHGEHEHEHFQARYTEWELAIYRQEVPSVQNFGVVSFFQFIQKANLPLNMHSASELISPASKRQFILWLGISSQHCLRNKQQSLRSTLHTYTRSLVFVSIHAVP